MHMQRVHVAHGTRMGLHEPWQATSAPNQLHVVLQTQPPCEALVLGLSGDDRM